MILVVPGRFFLLPILRCVFIISQMVSCETGYGNSSMFFLAIRWCFRMRCETGNEIVEVKFWFEKGRDKNHLLPFISLSLFQLVEVENGHRFFVTVFI